ncbi:unnamed protein product [Pedinophyceae sp. YPF-701]|nr:unnamed protein product [Pedinophyceae sp. YPF-701]
MAARLGHPEQEVDDLLERLRKRKGLTDPPLAPAPAPGRPMRPVKASSRGASRASGELSSRVSSGSRTSYVAEDDKDAERASIAAEAKTLFTHSAPPLCLFREPAKELTDDQKDQVNSVVNRMVTTVSYKCAQAEHPDLGLLDEHIAHLWLQEARIIRRLAGKRLRGNSRRQDQRTVSKKKIAWGVSSQPEPPVPKVLRPAPNAAMVHQDMHEFLPFPQTGRPQREHAGPRVELVGMLARMSMKARGGEPATFIERHPSPVPGGLDSPRSDSPILASERGSGATTPAAGRDEAGTSTDDAAAQAGLTTAKSGGSALQSLPSSGRSRHPLPPLSAHPPLTVAEKEVELREWEAMLADRHPGLELRDGETGNKYSRRVKAAARMLETKQKLGVSSYPTPQFFLRSSCGSASLHKRILDMSKKQADTMRKEKKRRGNRNGLIGP